MRRSFFLFLFVYSIATLAPIAAQGDLRLNGVWTLNRAMSESPREIGFNPDWVGSAPAGGSDAPAGGRGGRGGRSGGGASSAGNNAGPVRESADDAARVRLLTAEVRNPPSRLTIVDEAAAVAVSDDNGSRTFHPHGREEALSTTTMGLPDLVVTTRREGDRLVVTYRVEEGRQLRYTYSTTPSPRQLIVEAALIERGKVVDTVRRVYDRSVPNQTEAPSPAKPLSGIPGATPPAPAPAAPQAPPKETFDQRPDAELKGLTTLGFQLEELSPQAASCGLKRDAIDASLSKRLSDAGFTVLRRTSDNDTYLYVNINTTTATISQGVTLCVSRYDTFLYTHTVAKLPYTTQPVLVEVSLMHDGGIAGGGPAAHATGVQKGLEGELDQMIEKIKSANR